MQRSSNRHPSATILEYDGVRLRGLDSGYTQILINGKKVPGAGNDRSFFVDRIPAELVERIEIIRNTSANRSGDAVAGAINIVMREADIFDGAYQFDAAGGSNEFKLDYAAFDDETDNVEEEVGFDDDDTPPSFDEFEGTRERSETSDDELTFSYAHKRDVGGAELSFGIDYTDKQRDARLAVSEVSTDEEGAPLPPFDEFDVQRSDIEEQRIDPYVMLTGESDAFAWEAGLRYETTDVDVRFDDDRDDNDYAELLPPANPATPRSAISRTRSTSSSKRIPAPPRTRRASRNSIPTASSTAPPTSATARSGASSSTCRRR